MAETRMGSVVIKKFARKVDSNHKLSPTGETNHDSQMKEKTSNHKVTATGNVS